MLRTVTGTSHVMMMVMDDDDVVMVVMIVGESGHGRERKRGQQDCSEEFLQHGRVLCFQMRAAALPQFRDAYPLRILNLT
jgi:hypothetical protein